IGRPLTMLMPVRFQEAHRQGLARFLRTGDARVVGRVVELVGQRADGSEFPIELSIAHSVSRGEPFFIAILRDVTERYEAERQRLQAEEALRDSERRFRDLLENVALITIVVDTSAIVTFCNDSCAKLLGRPKEEIIG